MTSQSTAFDRALAPRETVLRYLEMIAEQRRQSGLVPMNGKWVTLEKRFVMLNNARNKSQAVLAEIILLFSALVGGSLLLLILTYYIAY